MAENTPTPRADLADQRPIRTRPEPDEYYMGVAVAVRERASCLGSRVGAVVVVNDRIAATGYNGTPEKMANCEDGGCVRCRDREKYPKGSGYDMCICVHAEQNALAMAASSSVAVAGGTIYTTMRPCFGCSKELLQAKIQAIRFIHDWTPSDPGLLAEYEKIQARFPKGVERVAIDDPQARWAVSQRRQEPADTGHTIPGN